MKENIMQYLPFYRWHPEVAMRYLPIVRFLLNHKVSRILEVGSGSLGIAPYIDLPVTGVDTNFNGPRHPRIKYVDGSVFEIPFPDKSWEAVLSVDMLEHLPFNQREKAISEMFRVASKYLILAFPSGKDSQKSDETLLEEYRKKFGENFQFLKEHQLNQLPGVGDIKKYIPKSYAIESQGNENLNIRLFLMRGWMAKSRVIDIFFRKILLVLLPFEKLWNRQPYYRQIIYVTIKS